MTAAPTPGFRCSRCRQIKPREAYSPSRLRRRLLTCRACAFEVGQINYQRSREVVDQIKLERGCADCGYREHAVALQFDHLPGSVKRSKVSQLMVGYSLDAVLREIEKCEVVCANCHAIRTLKRGTAKAWWAAYRAGLPTPAAIEDPQQAMVLS